MSVRFTSLLSLIIFVPKTQDEINRDLLEIEKINKEKIKRNKEGKKSALQDKLDGYKIADLQSIKKKNV